MKFIVLLAMLLTGPAAATEADDAINQARHFMKKNWHADAIQELEVALTTPSGRSAFEVHALLAEAYFQTHNALKAQQHATRAIELNTSPARKAEIKRFLGFLKSNFGVLHLASPYPGMESPIQIGIATPILDPRVATYLKALSKELGAGTVLPARIGFPAGNFTVNGIPVAVKLTKKRGSICP